MGTSSRRGCRAEMLAQDFHFHKCITLHTKPPFFDIFAIPPRPNAFFQNDLNTHTYNYCKQSVPNRQLVPILPYFSANMRISISHGRYCSDSSFRAFRMESVTLLELRFSNGQNGGGRVFLGVLGCSWGAPVGHVTADLACYSRPGILQDPLQLSFHLSFHPPQP